MKQKSRLGIVDWGIGGVSVHKLVKSRLGNLPVIYFSDTGATPYGKMSRRELISRLSAVIDFLRRRGVTHLVIGCNAASTAIPFLKIDDFPVEGVIESALFLTAQLKPPRLALIGGRRTVLSGIYRRGFAARGIQVSQRIAQPLSALIESGDTSSGKLREECRKILAPVKNCSHLLLACTHYPAITPVLRDFVSAQTILLDPAGELVNRIGRWKLPAGGGTDIFLTTGDAGKMKSAAQKAFDFSVKEVEKINI